MAKKNKSKKNQATNPGTVKNTNAVKKYIMAKLCMPEDLSEKVHVETMAVIQSTQFDKISIPLSAYRASIGTKETEDDNRVSTVGYIKDFDLEKNQFQVVIFNGNKETIEAFKNPIIIPVITVYNNSLGTIVKFIIDDQKETKSEDQETGADNTEDAKTDSAPADESECDKEENANHLSSKIEIPAEVKESVSGAVPVTSSVPANDEGAVHEDPNTDSAPEENAEPAETAEAATGGDDQEPTVENTEPAE